MKDKMDLALGGKLLFTLQVVSFLCSTLL